MRKSDSDKQSILIFKPGQFKAWRILFSAFLVFGCATAPDTQDGVDNGVDEAEAPALRALVTDPDVQFHLLAAERLGAVGDYEEALEHYLNAARLSTDPAVAEQVTGLSAGLGEWPVVVQSTRRWLELDPDNRSARQIHVVALLRTDEIPAAAEVLAASIGSAEDRDAAWREAISLLASALPDEAAESTLELLIVSTGTSEQPADVALQRSRMAWQLGDLRAAFDQAETAAGLDGSRETTVWAAQLAMANDLPEQALYHYRLARRHDPEDVELALSEAEVLRQLDDLDGALEALEDLPPGPEVLYTRGSFLHAAERRDEAVATWRELTAVAAEDPLTHAFYTGFLAELLELGSEARTWYARVDSGRLKPRADLRRATLAAEAGDLDEARALLGELRTTGDGLYLEQSFLAEAQILRDSSHSDDALELLSGALTELPDSIPLLYGRALTAVDRNDIDLAEQDLRAILHIDSDNAVALNALGYTLTDRTDRHREAYRLIRRAYEIEPDNAAIQDSMGWVYFRMGQPEEAVPYLRRALEEDYHPEIAAHLGEVLIELGELEEGRAVLEQAREAFPDDEYLAETMVRLGLEP